MELGSGVAAALVINGRLLLIAATVDRKLALAQPLQYQILHLGKRVQKITARCAALSMVSSETLLRYQVPTMEHC